MARISIEINDTATAGEAGGAIRVQTTGAPHTIADVSGVPAELAAKAAALGAHNAGSAPSAGGFPTGAAPAPFISPNLPEPAPSRSASPGAAPAPRVWFSPSH